MGRNSPAPDARLRPTALLLALVALGGGAARAGSTADQPTPGAATTPGSGKVGLVIGPAAQGGAIVTGVLPGTPAERAGLLPLDRIVKVDGRDVTREGLAAIISRITGTPGTAVSLAVDRNGQPLTVTLQRASLAGRFNDAAQNPRVARLVRWLVGAQGGAARIAAIKQVSWEAAAASGERQYRDVAPGGYRTLTCAATGLVTVAGHDGRRAWGVVPPGVSLEETAQQLMHKPHLLLPNLVVAEFGDPAAILRYRGRTTVAPPDWLGFKVPRAVHRFEHGDQTYDFDVASGQLVRLVDSNGYPGFLGDYRRVDGVAVPGRRTAGQTVLVTKRVSFAAIPAARFATRGSLHCAP